jgi:hypothetical protein
MKTSPVTISERKPQSINERIEAELDLIKAALHDPTTTPEIYCQLYAAQQALEWVLNPLNARHQFGTITDGKVQPLIRDTPAS